ncbi:hypothetical protein [Buttiauxella ferragutiae]|uniref:hypothetical protein n=1 Tax=Buttiauxella ferragutiae TaxID=82989 RepID=UPI00352501B6
MKKTIKKIPCSNPGLQKNIVCILLLLMPIAVGAEETEATGILSGTPPSASISPNIYYHNEPSSETIKVSFSDKPGDITANIQPENLHYENLTDKEGDLFSSPPHMEYLSSTPSPDSVQLAWKDDTGNVVTPVASESFIDQGLAGKTLTLTASFTADTKIKLFSDTGVPTENDITAVSLTRTVNISEPKIVGARVATTDAEYTWPFGNSADVAAPFPTVGFSGAQFIIETGSTEDSATEGAAGPTVATIASDNKQAGYEWSSSNDAVATVVSDTGLVSLKGHGETTITGKVNGKKVVSYDFNVKKWFIRTNNGNTAKWAVINGACNNEVGYTLPHANGDVTLARLGEGSALRTLAGEILYPEWGDTHISLGTSAWTVDAGDKSGSYAVVALTNGVLRSNPNTYSNGGICVNLAP